MDRDALVTEVQIASTDLCRTPGGQALWTSYVYVHSFGPTWNVVSEEQLRHALAWIHRVRQDLFDEIRAALRLPDGQ